MKRSLIDAARERGEPVAVLWATEDTIYGQFGYGMASVAAEIDLPREHAAPFARIDAPGQARLVPLDAKPSRWSRRSTHAWRARRPGMYARTSAWWQDRLLIDQPWRRQGGGALRCAVLGDRRRAHGLRVLSRQSGVRARPSSRPHLRGRGDGRFAAGDRTRSGASCSASTGCARVKAIFLPLDHPLLLSLAAPRRLNFLVREGLWVRLIDVGAALSARGYATDDTVVIEVTDEFCPWNAGRWRVARGGVEKTARRGRSRLRRRARSAASISAASRSRSLRARCA